MTLKMPLTMLRGLDSAWQERGAMQAAVSLLGVAWTRVSGLAVGPFSACQIRGVASHGPMAVEGVHCTLGRHRGSNMTMKRVA
jgi:hypothetical protein